MNEEIINDLNKFNEYIIELAQEKKEQFKIKNVSGINSTKNPEEVINVFADADLVTTAVVPNVLPLIAPLIAKGIQKRKKINSTQPLDIIACENMIGGSDFLKKEVVKYLSDKEIQYLEQYIGFPNTAVDRIVPLQTHEDPLFVSVEPYKEWIISEKDRLYNLKD